MPKPQTPSAAIAPSYTPEEREAQRIAHLVHGAPRPKVKGANRRRRGKAPQRIVLAPGIEERVALREDWSHKAEGTAETHAHAAIVAGREGALARLHATGAIDAHQLAAAHEIALAHEGIVAGVAVRTARYEQRGSTGGPDAAAVERIGAVIRERAYTDWRAAAGPHAAMLLAIIVDDMAVTVAARRWRLSNRRAKAVLVTALDRWRRGEGLGRTAQGVYIRE